MLRGLHRLLRRLVTRRPRTYPAPAALGINLDANRQSKDA